MEDFNENMNYNYNYDQPNGAPHSDPNNQFYTISEENKPIWAAITSFVLSLVNVVSCCCCGYIAIIASLVFGIISLANKWRGKGLAIAGVVISSVCLVVTLASQIFLGGLSVCLTDVMVTAPEYYEEYMETGELPEEMEKYNNDEYDWYWKLMGNENFADFYNQWMTLYGAVAENSQYSEDNESSDVVIDDEDFYDYSDTFGGDESYEPEFGEIPVDL